MSTDNQPAQTQQMSGDQAYQTLFDDVYCPVFREKLANVYGIVPQTTEEFGQLLDMAGKLKQAEDAQGVKQANANASFLTQANAGLDQLMGGAGSVPTPDDVTIKNAAAQAAQVPKLQHAALAYQHAVALEMTQQAG